MSAGRPEAQQQRAARRAAAVAALSWSWSLWVLHVHLFERETWAALGTALAMGLALAPAGTVRARALAGALLLAFLMKITALFAALGVLLHLLCVGRARRAVRTAGWLAAGVAAATLLGWWAWGTPFLWQVYLFGFFRNAPDHSVLASAVQLLRWSGPLLLLAYAALASRGLPSLRRPAGLPAAVFAAMLLYQLLISPTLWAHNLIGLAAPAALVLAAQTVAWPAGRRAFLGVLMGLVVVLVSLGQWLSGDFGPSGVGFGGWGRQSLERRAEFVARWSYPGDVVLTDNPWIALQADRAEAVRYWDLQPVAQGLEASLAMRGLLATWADRQGPLVLGPGGPAPGAAVALGPYQGRLLANALCWTRPLLLDELSEWRIALVLEPLPPGGILEARDLRAAGYTRFTDARYGLAAWRPPGASRPRLRPLYGNPDAPRTVPAGTPAPGPQESSR